MPKSVPSGSSKESSNSPKDANKWPKESSNPPKDTSKRPKESSNSPKDASKWPKESSSSPKDASKWPKETSKLASGGSENRVEPKKRGKRKKEKLLENEAWLCWLPLEGFWLGQPTSWWAHANVHGMKADYLIKVVHIWKIVFWEGYWKWY